MLDIREGVVPAVESSEMDRQTLSYAINDFAGAFTYRLLW
jgi:hypothetical protein